MKKITLELQQSIYDKAKEEVRKEYKWRHFTNLIGPITFLVFIGIYSLVLSPSKYESGKIMCDYLITTEVGTSYIKLNSNPTPEEMKKAIGDVKVSELRQLACEDER